VRGNSAGEGGPLLSGDTTSVSFSFAFFGVNERYGDITPAMRDVDRIQTVRCYVMRLTLSQVAPTLIIFAGLPAVGKTKLSLALARQIDAVYVRIDTIEQVLRDCGLIIGSWEDYGYQIGYAVASDNLRVGRSVVADSVNPISVTRSAWAAVASQAGAVAINVEVKCSDAIEHRRRVETRVSEIAGLKLPNWEEVTNREYDTWADERIVIDTAGRSVEGCLKELLTAVSAWVQRQ
jgi:predicted kinase